MSDDPQAEAKAARKILQERLDKNDVLFKQSIDAPMKVTVTPDGAVVIEYPFQLADFEKAGTGNLSFTPLAAKTLKAILNASDSIPEMVIGEAGTRAIN